MTPLIITFFRVLKFPLRLLINLFRKRSRTKRNEQERKLLTHVRNFAPTHYSWQKSVKKSKNSRKILKKKTNNSKS